MEFQYVSDTKWDETHVSTIHIDEICTNLVRLGHRVTLYIPSTNKAIGEKEYAIVYVPASQFITSLIFQAGLFFRLLADVRKNTGGVLYVRSSSLLFIPSLVARLRKVPLFLEVNGKLSEEVSYEGTLLSKILFYTGIFKAIERFNLRSASGLIAVKEGIRDYLVKFGVDAEKIRIILNGVDVSLFKPGSRLEVRKKTSLDPAALYVGYIGSFYEWQGLRYIADAAKIVCGLDTRAKFLFLGSGADAEYLKTFVSKHSLEGRIEIRPAVPHAQIPEYISSLDICISYPNISRGSGTSPFKMYEYLASGRCVVSADILGMREEFGDTVVYAPPESPEELAKVLLALLNDPEKRASLGEQGRLWVEKGHSWEAVAKEVAAFCQEFAG